MAAVAKLRLEKNSLVRDEIETREKCPEKEQHSQAPQQLSQQEQQQTRRPAYSISKMTQMARVSVCTYSSCLPTPSIICPSLPGMS